MSGICFGGGSAGGGGGSRAFGIDIGKGETVGDRIEPYELDLLDVRNRSEGLKSWTLISGVGRAMAGLVVRWGMSMLNMQLPQAERMDMRYRVTSSREQASSVGGEQ